MSSSTYVYTLNVPQLAKPPQTVVSLVPSVTESLFDLALGDRLIAITDYCVHPKEKVQYLPRIGGTKNPDVARIIAMQPDLVIVNQEENRRDDVQKLMDAGLTVWITFPKTVMDVFNLLWDIMNLFEKPEMSPRVRLIEQIYDWVMGITRAHEHQPVRVFVPIWLDPLMTFNQDTYIHDLLRVCGGTSIFANRQRAYPLAADISLSDPYPEDDPRLIGRDTRYPRITWEEVVAGQPDVILLPSEPYPFTTEHLALFASLDVPAARHNRIHLVDGSLLTWHGTRIAYALDTLPALFYPPESL